MSFIDYIGERHGSNQPMWPHDKPFRFMARLSFIISMVGAVIGGIVGILFVIDPAVPFILKLYLLPYIHLAVIDWVIWGLVGLILPLGMLIGAFFGAASLVLTSGGPIVVLWIGVETLALMYTAFSYDSHKPAMALLGVGALAALTVFLFPSIPLTTVALVAASIFVVPALIFAIATFSQRGLAMGRIGLIAVIGAPEAIWQKLVDDEPLLGFLIQSPKSELEDESASVDIDVLNNLLEEPYVPHQSMPGSPSF